MAATKKRENFFISVSPRSLELLLAGETLRRFNENGTHVRKARDFALAKMRMLRPELVPGLTPSSQSTNPVGKPTINGSGCLIQLKAHSRLPVKG
jgi:hypothetical protein